MLGALGGSCSFIPAPLTTRNQAYHTGAAAVEDLQGGVKLGHVEFDDQGELWSHGQLRTVTESIRGAAEKGPVKLLLYAHGWNNSSRPGKSPGINLQQFKHLLNALGEVSRSGDDYPYQIFGVYLGWRGHELSTRSYVDIWDRLQAAARVGGLSGTEAVVDLALAARTNPKSLVLLTGHSLGTIIAENTANRVLMARALEAKYRPGGGRPLFDIVLLVNSAQSSLIPHQMITGLKEQHIRYRNARSGDVPLICLVTAADDWLTGKLFPLSVLAARANPLNTQVSGKVRSRYAEGPDGDTGDRGSQFSTQFKAGAHNVALLSHEMTVVENSERKSRSGAEAGPVAAMREVVVRNLTGPARTASGDIPISGDTHDFALTSKADAWNDTPYWVCRTPKRFFSGHGGFWDNNNIVALTAALLRLGHGGAQLSAGR